MKSNRSTPARAQGKSRRPSLQALTTAALALPGMAVAQAPDQLQTDYLFSYYRESDIPGSRNTTGSDVERYQVRTHQFRMAQPFETRSLGLDVLYERLTGASPWYVMPDSDGQPVQVMSGPTIEETRIDTAISGMTPLTDELATTVSAGYSTEDDYRSAYGNLEFEYRPGGRGPLSLNASAGYARDRLAPTQGATPTSVLRANKRTLRMNVGAGYILNPQTLLQGSFGYQEHEGFLSDPYKAVWIVEDATTVPDNRPDGRRGYHGLARVRHFVDWLQGALHADYRYFRDNWKIRSHNVELTWHQTLPARWRLSPGLRWYSQSQAFFYAPFFESQPNHGFVSSDYRLAPFGAFSYRLDATYSWDRWAFRAGVEHYRARGSYAAGSVDVDAPGLVKYTAFSMGVAASF